MSAENPSDKTRPAAEVVEMYRAQGRIVIEAAGCWWYNAYGQNRVFFSFPPHRLLTAGAGDLEPIFAASRAAAARFIGPPDPRYRASFIWTARPPYDIETLSANSRSKVRRGLKQCQVRRIGFDELTELGQQAQQDTMSRLGHEARRMSVSAQMKSSPAFEAWGAFHEGALAAYVILLKVDGWVHIQVNRSANEFLKYYPNNALIYTVTSHFLSISSIEAVCYGLEPIEEMESLEQFKLSMGYIKEPVSQRIVPAPRLRLLVNPATIGLIRLAAGLFKNNRRLNKLAGLLRYVQG